MGDILIIVWVPITIAFMAVAFVITLGAAGAASIEPARLPSSASQAIGDPTP